MTHAVPVPNTVETLDTAPLSRRAALGVGGIGALIALLGPQVLQLPAQAAQRIRYQLPFPLSASTDPYGRLATRFHRGHDFGRRPIIRTGVVIPAVADGIVVSKGVSTSLGNYLVLSHADGMFSGYAHMKYRSPLLVGGRIGRGERLGQVGATGIVTGPHLHLSLSTSPAMGVDGHIDPIPYITDRLGTPPTDDIRRYSVYHVINIATTGTYAGWQGTLGLKFIRHHGSSSNAALTRGLLPVIRVNGDAELAVAVNAFGIPRASIPMSGKEYYGG